MEKLKKIPVIGYFLRILVGIARLPKHIEDLYQKNLEKDRIISEQNECISSLKLELETSKQASKSEIDQLQSMCMQLQNQQILQYNSLSQWNQDRMNEIGQVQDWMKNFEQVKVSKDYLKKLNYRLSLQPTIWGSENRLKISKLASVHSCSFNTNSGTITIGDYTFAGMGVSLLAGSHDQRLTGLLRRDVEIDKGCDIEIGQGVWLASNCTILGPAKVNDHAVIAAGAVIVPNTIVETGAIYAGIPAKCIGYISLADEREPKSEAILEAFERRQNLLFAAGFGELSLRIKDEKEYWGHELVSKKALLLIKDKALTLEYQIDSDAEISVGVLIDGKKEIKKVLQKECGVLTIDEPELLEGVHQIDLVFEEDNIFFVVSEM